MKITGLLVLLLASACSHSIQGKLQSADGGVISSEDARINISRLSSSDDATGGDNILVVPVKEDGTWQSDSSFGEGRYLIEALVPGYEVQSETVEWTDKSLPVAMELKKRADVKRTTFRATDDGSVARGAGGVTLMPPKM